MDNLIKKLEELREKAIETADRLDIEGKKGRLRDLRYASESPDFWQDQKKAVAVGKEIEELSKETGAWDDLLGRIRETEEFVALADKEGEVGMDDDLSEQYQKLSVQFENLEFKVLLNKIYDKNSVILSIHAGTGGVDAQDWAEMLERMYLRFAEKQNWRAEILDRLTGAEAGIKTVVLRIEGVWAYGYLKGEAGVHRLVRISPFDAEGMRQTSFALVDVLPEIDNDDGIIIKDEDLRIDVYRSSGPGGQSVNTTDSAVRVVHIPTGITVACQNERSQHQNKENALKILKSKLAHLAEERKQEEMENLRGEVQKAEWGKQIRSYVLQPYKLVKDHRTNYETTEVDKVLDGDILEFSWEYLKQL